MITQNMRGGTILWRSEARASFVIGILDREPGIGYVPGIRVAGNGKRRGAELPVGDDKPGFHPAFFCKGDIDELRTIVMSVFDLDRKDPGFEGVIQVIRGDPEITPDPVPLLLYRPDLFSSIFSTEFEPGEGWPFMSSKWAVSIVGSVHLKWR